MTEFGIRLRKFRQQCNDAKSSQGKLTQETFGELVGRELGISYSGAAVSDWERGKSRIHADDRTVLVALIKVFHDHGGLRTVDEANQLLKAGNFRNLDPEETEKIFGEKTDAPKVEQMTPEQYSSKSMLFALVESVFAISEPDLQEAFAKAEAGPYPSWPRNLAWFMRKGSERWSLSISSVFWMATWALAWWLVPPSLRWPFPDQSYSFSAMVMYACGTLAVPLLIGLLVKTKESEYWKQQGLAGSNLLRMYTYQGAAIGFNLGYFLVFPFILVNYYLQLGLSIWLELVAVTLGLILGNMGARVVPHNLWLAYHRLHFRDGAIFFVVAFLGPLWGLFFLEYYSVLLTPFWGGIVILAALLLFILIPVGRSRKKTDTEQAQP
jgi:hypothetical protein